MKTATLTRVRFLRSWHCQVVVCGPLRARESETVSEEGQTHDQFVSKAAPSLEKCWGTLNRTKLSAGQWKDAAYPEKCLLLNSLLCLKIILFFLWSIFQPGMWLSSGDTGNVSHTFFSVYFINLYAHGFSFYRVSPVPAGSVSLLSSVTSSTEAVITGKLPHHKGFSIAWSAGLSGENNSVQHHTWELLF